MTKPVLNIRPLLAALAVIAFIVYGSLFPFAFHALAGGQPVAVLLGTWRTSPEHFGNLIGNIFFYIPLGFFAALSLGPRLPAFIRLFATVAIGAALSLSMELIQLYVTGRVSTFADVYPNVLGTFVGSAVGLVWGAGIGRPRARYFRARPVPMLLLAAFIGYRLFPYVPSLDLHQYWRALQPLLVDRWFDDYAIAGYTVVWLLAAATGQAIVGASAARWLLFPAIGCVLAAQVAVLGNSVNGAEILGGALAVAVWLALSRASGPWQAIMLAAALAVFVVAERLQPFDFRAATQAFGWVPFESFMHGSMAVNTQSFLEKFFLYGGLIWLLTQAGVWRAAAGMSVALGLLATSVLQTGLPGRSAEISDAAMALLIAVLFALIDRASAKAEGASRDDHTDLPERNDDAPAPL